jgi:hypothetical protein
VFLRNQNNIDGFAANFCELPNGELLFAPKGPETGLPVTWDEYGDVLAAYERIHTQGMVVNWILWLGAGAYGLYQLIAHDAYRPFFIAVGIALVLTVLLGARDAMGCLLPFEERRRTMLRQASEGVATASPD